MTCGFRPGLVRPGRVRAAGVVGVDRVPPEDVPGPSRASDGLPTARPMGAHTSGTASTASRRVRRRRPFARTVEAVRWTSIARTGVHFGRGVALPPRVGADEWKASAPSAQRLAGRAPTFVPGQRRYGPQTQRNAIGDEEIPYGWVLVRAMSDVPLVNAIDETARRRVAHDLHMSRDRVAAHSKPGRESCTTNVARGSSSRFRTFRLCEPVARSTQSSSRANHIGTAWIDLTGSEVARTPIRRASSSSQTSASASRVPSARSLLGAGSLITQERYAVARHDSSAMLSHVND